jgi:uncharacterized membrane protein YccC
LPILHKKVNWRHGLKTAIAAGICLALVRLLKFQQGYWACVSTIVVMQSETAATVMASRDRLIGTALGAVLGWLTATWWHGHLWIYVLIILLGMLLPEVFGLKNAGRMAGVTATIILLVPGGATPSVVALRRFVEVSFGIVVSLVVSQLLWRETTPKVGTPGRQSQG